MNNDMVNLFGGEALLGSGVAGNTKIRMAYGMEEEIKKIIICDRVMTQQGKSSVVRNILRGTESRLVYLRTETGQELYMSDGHLVMTGRGFVQAGDLKAADIIELENGKAGIAELHAVERNEQVYSLELDEPGIIFYNGIAGGDFETQKNMEAKIKITASSSDASALQIEIEKLYKHLAP